MLKLFSPSTLLASLQWLFFIFANTFIVPILIGTAFELSAEQIAITMRLSFILTGIACILQGWIGHRFSLMEGPSGLMWGLMIGLGAAAPSVGISYASLGGGLVTGIILAGIVTILLGWLNLIHIVQKLFPPIVMSVYLFLLAIQLVLIFFNGMFPLTDNGQLDIPIALFSLFLVIFVGTIMIKGKGMISNFAILIGMVFGWIAFALLFETSEPVASASLTHIILFPLGKPNLEIGIVLTGFIAGLLNLSNNFTSLFAAESLYNKKASNGRVRSSFVFTGFFNSVAPIFGVVPFATYSSSIAFLESTQILDRRPFILGGSLVMLLGIIAPLGSFLASMPLVVGNAVLFVAYIQMFGTALRSVKDFEFNSRNIYQLGLPVLVGLCIMNLSPNVFSNLPIYIRPLISNGLLMGILLSIILDKTIKWPSSSTTIGKD